MWKWEKDNFLDWYSSVVMGSAVRRVYHLAPPAVSRYTAVSTSTSNNVCKKRTWNCSNTRLQCALQSQIPGGSSLADFFAVFFIFVTFVICNETQKCMTICGQCAVLPSRFLCLFFIFVTFDICHEAQKQIQIQIQKHENMCAVCSLKSLGGLPFLPPWRWTIK